MNLTFDESFYESVALGEDSPVIRELEETAQTFSAASAVGMNVEELLDVMENLDSLMNYYAAGTDFQRLEPIMRKQQELLDLCREQDDENIGYLFLQMKFLRINAILYSSNGQLQQSAEYYKKAVTLAENCFSLLQSDDELSGKQVLYVGWNCILLIKEVADTEEKFARHESSVYFLRTILPMLSWLEPVLVENTDIADGADLYDRIAGLYAGIGAVLFPEQEMKNANTSYQHAIKLYESIDEQQGSDFFRAKAIWTKSNYGMQRVIFQNNTDVLENCQADVDNFFVSRSPSERDRAIVEGALGNLMLSKSCSCQVTGDLQGALSYSQKSCHYLEMSLQVLEKVCKDANGYGKIMLSTMANQIYSQLISGLDAIGVQYYGADDFDSAEEAFSKAVSLLADKPEYTIGETYSVIVQAECYQYLTLVSINKGNAEQAGYYGKNAVAMANQAAEATNNPTTIGLAVTSNAVMAEFYLNMKDKTSAKQCADTGVTYCERLRSLNPQAPQLEMEAYLQKLQRKASRKFF
jgi:tetratricopeptide (TPR) repeat protein